jgi:membrane protein implicated in regulation of membrane protease activity
MVLDAIDSLGTWSWFVLGLILLGIEILAPGTFMLWLGLAAIAVGVLALLVDIPWQGQLVAFAGFALVAVLLWWQFARTRGGRDTDEPMLNRRAERYVGRDFVLNEPILRGQGRVAIDDSVWRIAGDDCPAGTRVRVTRTDGATLVVVRA